MSENIFHNNKMYSQSLSPIKDNIKQVSTIMAKKYDITVPQAESIYKSIIKDSEAKAPEVTYWDRESNGDKFKKKTTLNKYISNAIVGDNVIVPSFTTYLPTKKHNSLHKAMILGNLKNRSREKKTAHRYYSEGNTVLGGYHDTLQKSLKLLNNSFSGAYGSGGTILYNISAHYTLTSMTRAVASIGNGVTESMVMGNRHYWNINDPINHIAALITNIDKDAFSKAIEKYKLVIPTVDQVMETILYSSRIYWKSVDKENVIREIVETLEPIERAMVVYVNDLYSVKMYNNDFMKKFIERLSLKVYSTVDTNIDRLNKADDDVMNLVHHICIPELRGRKIDYKVFPKDIQEILLGTYDNVVNVFNEYSDLVRELFLTNVMPINIVDIKEMTRRAIALSDTDSTCGAYHYWVKWFFGDNVKYGDDDVIGLTASIMTIVAGSAKHYIKVLASNMNVDEKDKGMLDMKNEFYWDIFVAANKSKHYYANTRVKEMVVFDKDVLEVKGSGLISATLPDKYRKKFTTFVTGIMKDIGQGKLLNGKDTIKYVADIERDILKSLKIGDYSSLMTDSIKEPSGYKQGPLESKYKYVTLWNQVMGKKYGDVKTVPIRVANIKVTTGSKRKVLDWINTIEDPVIKANFEKYFEKHPITATGMKIFRVPMDNIRSGGIPIELHNILDYKEMVASITAPFITVLETLSLFTKPDMTLMEQGY